MRKKVTIVGAGNVGATAAQRIHELGYADVPRRRTKMAMTSQSTAPGMPEATNTTQSDVIHHSGPWKMNDQEKATTKATATM